jgi:hypothetical protein
MAWKTEISIRNNKPEDVLCVIPKGQIFENKKVGTSVQNVAAAREYRLIIPASSKIVVEIDVFCINRTFAAPKGLPGAVSIYQINLPFGSQQQLWDALAVHPSS